jgi:orotate phosphoribosyltransferase
MKAKIAKSLLSIGATGFKPDQPLTFKSRIISSMYCDNRIFPVHPEDWK